MRRWNTSVRAYGQRDPLVEYKKEGLKLFQGLEAGFAAHVASSLPNMFAGGQGAPMRAREGEAVQKAATEITASATPQSGSKYGRNDKVTITDGTTTEEMKFKKAEPLLASGKWRIVQ